MTARRSAPADATDPHLRLPKPLRVARAAEAAFVVVTSYVALSLPLGASEAGQLIRARLVLEAGVALAILLGLSRRPRGSRVAAMVLAAFVLLGCIPHLGRLIPAVAASVSPFSLLSLTISLAGCGAQAVVLAACLLVRDPLPSR